MATVKPEPGTQAVDRALHVLSAFGKHGAHLGITDLAGIVDLTPSTVHRLVRALVLRGFLEQDPETERYRLGRTMAVLGQAALDDLGLSGARNVLERLGTKTGESLNLGVRAGQAVLVVARVSSAHALRFDHEPGQRIPLHATSMGKALLAFSDDPAGEVEALVADGQLQAFTPTTLVTGEDLHADLEATRRRGYSVDDEESIEGVRCLGAPVFDRTGQPRAAIAIQAPAVRLPPEAADATAVHLIAAAAEIARVMGFQD